MESKPRRLGNVLPIMCKRHGTTTCMVYAEDWEKTDGGCMNPCDGILRCGHPCHLQCHPYSHEIVQCAEECPKTLACGHGCSNKCGEICICPCEEFSRIKQAELMSELNVADGSGQLGQDTRATNFNGQNNSTHGSASYSPQQAYNPSNAKWRVHPVRGWGPADETTNLTDQRSMRTGYHTPQETMKSSSMSPQKQGQLLGVWRDYAKGGFAADDERLHLMAAPETLALYPSESGAKGKTKTSPIKEEAVKVMPNGRVRVLQLYQPGQDPKQGPPDISISNIKAGGPPTPSISQHEPSPRKVLEDRRVRSPAETIPGSSRLTKPKKGGSAVDELKALDSFFRGS